MEQNAFEPVPVIFIVFNRPEVTMKTFARIRQARPSKLFIVADGPRADRSGEAEKCEQCRAVEKMVDWDCEVNTNFAESNMGCKNRVASGITWAFQHVEEAIILEDDCVPSMSFFRFCREMLDRYRDDRRVMVISGSNQDVCNEFPWSYCFCKKLQMWGWATWKRAWDLFDVDMKIWEECRENEWLKNILTPEEYFERTNELQTTYEGYCDTWDYQFMLSAFLHHGLDIIPKVNMIRNIGFGPDATHTTNELDKAYFYLDEEMEFPLTHPPVMLPFDRPRDILTPRPPLKKLQTEFQERNARFQRLLSEGKFREAIALFKGILRADKRIELLHVYYLMQAYQGLGDHYHAKALFDDLIQAKFLQPPPTK